MDIADPDLLHHNDASPLQWSLSRVQELMA